MSDFCSEISVIPQFGGTCWFNAILMSCFYSQEMRKLMINKISKTWNKNSSFFKFLKTILKKNYNKNNKIITLFNKVKPELLLLKFMFENDKRLLEDYKKQNIGIGYGGIITYISDFLKKLNVNVLDINYINKNDKYIFNFNKIYNNLTFELNTYKVILMHLKKNNDFMFNNINNDIEKKEIENIINEIPDVLLVNFSEQINNVYNKTTIFKIFDSDNYNINLDDLKKHKEKINFNGYKYKLDSIIISNYNVSKIYKGHGIAGITCNNKKYIYNGWSKNLKVIYNNYAINEPCKLQKFDWNINKDEIFGVKRLKCELSKDIDEKKDIAYSFMRGSRVLVYVRIDNNKTSSIKSFSISSLSKTKKLLKDYYNLKKLKDFKKIY